MGLQSPTPHPQLLTEDAVSGKACSKRLLKYSLTPPDSSQFLALKPNNPWLFRHFLVPPRYNKSSLVEFAGVYSYLPAFHTSLSDRAEPGPSFSQVCSSSEGPRYVTVTICAPGTSSALYTRPGLPLPSLREQD